ncbi:hypothetical protein PoB_007038800 [Plakobranchus ocellatus]|uniref:Uncharacterized protein n=1 Tax=Plakobranchus ocellatus TaxID=259542 RepID=A0AAV4DIK9_9GAST|nr:hypothetical protein PoB_007038800 [Plakobranchus ocellatus]
MVFANFPPAITDKVINDIHLFKTMEKIRDVEIVPSSFLEFPPNEQNQRNIPVSIFRVSPGTEPTHHSRSDKATIRAN